MRTQSVKTQAVSYLRVSGKGQVDGDGFPRQRQAIATYAKRHGLELVEEYRDEGVSGTRELEDRPGLARVLDRVENNGVKVVIVERADRLARDLMIGEIILDQFRRAGVRVVAADGTDLTTNDNPTTVMVRQILGAVAQFDKAMTVAKLRAARQRLRAKGARVEGRKPYGTHPNERALLDRMRTLRRKPVKGARLSYAAIAAQLNTEGHTTRYGRPWTRDGVCKALARD
jgi:DNA invertase Pin-like site-specific DNA recombinase